MSSGSPSWPVRLAACAAGVALVGLVGWFVLRPRPNDQTDNAASKAFRESATDAGLTWKMRFLTTEQGETFKINLYDHGCGLAVGDFDGDGLEDIYFCNQLGPNALYHNKGDGTFEDVAKQAGVELGDRVCVGATFVDYDNSGLQSLYVTSTRGGNVFFKNLGNGTFKDITDEVGLKHIGHSQTAVFFDYDGDGYLDLFLTNTAFWTEENLYIKSSRHWAGKGDFGGVMFSPKEDNVLYHNVPVDPKNPSKGRKFVDVTATSGLKGRGWAGDAVAFDYNGDGKLDLFVTSMFGRCQLYRNNGNGTFTDVTLEVLGKTPYGGMGARVFDFNNDGRLDLYVVDMHSDMWMGADREHTSLPIAKEWEKKKFPYLYGPYALKEPEKFIARENEEGQKLGFKHEELLFGNACWRNDGNGKFTEVSDPAGLETFWPWGIATGDFDNDGYEDVLVPAGMGYPFYYWPNSLLMNRGDGTFADRATDMGIEPPPRGQFGAPIGGKEAARSSRCAVTGDFRRVGLLDIVVNNFNDQPYYFKNQLPRRNYVAFRLQGTKSNRDAIGAVVRLYRGDKIMTRQVQAACGYLSHSSRTLHFGLGDSAEFDHVEITWPSGLVQRLDKVKVNDLNPVVEP